MAPLPTTPEKRVEFLTSNMHRMADGLSLRDRVHIRKGKPAPVSASSMAALEANRKKTSLKADEGTNLKRCNHCRRVAIREAPVCWFHGGRKIKMRIRAALGQPIDTKVRVQKRRAAFLAYRGAVPAGLMQHPTFQSVLAALKAKKSETELDWQEHYARRTMAGVMMYELIVAYSQFEIDPYNTEPWFHALEKCRQANFL